MAAQKSKQINLLPKSSFDDSPFGRVLVWLTTTFRVMVIITELIVLAAFLSRFWLDARNSDLNTEIKQKQAQILASANFENEFRQTQKKLDIYSQLIKNEGLLQETITAIQNSLVPETYLTRIAFSENNTLTIEGISATELGIAQFATNLKAKSGIKNAYIKEANSNSDSGLSTEFVLEALLEKEN